MLADATVRVLRCADGAPVASLNLARDRVTAMATWSNVVITTTSSRGVPNARLVLPGGATTTGICSVWRGSQDNAHIQSISHIAVCDAAVATAAGTELRCWRLRPPMHVVVPPPRPFLVRVRTTVRSWVASMRRKRRARRRSRCCCGGAPVVPRSSLDSTARLPRQRVDCTQWLAQHTAASGAQLEWSKPSSIVRGALLWTSSIVDEHSGHITALECVVRHGQAPVFVSGCARGVVKAWDACTGAMLWASSGVGAGGVRTVHEGAITALVALPHQVNGVDVLSVCRSGAVVGWQLSGSVVWSTSMLREARNTGVWPCVPTFALVGHVVRIVHVGGRSPKVVLGLSSGETVLWCGSRCCLSVVGLPLSTCAMFCCAPGTRALASAKQPRHGPRMHAAPSQPYRWRLVSA